MSSIEQAKQYAENKTENQTGDATPQPAPEQLQQYAQAFEQALCLEYPLGKLLRHGLQQLQQSLGLSSAVVEAIELQSESQFQARQKRYQFALEQYQQTFAQAAALGLPLSPDTLDRLAELRRSLELREPDVKLVEGQVLSRFFVYPPVTEVSDAPPTELAATGSADAPTELPPHEFISFISADDMPLIESAPLLLPLHPEVELRSEKGIDYQPLRDLLRASRWQEADEATLSVMLAAADRTSQGWLNEEALRSFPRLDLHTIDRLWSAHSNAKFGFTAQLHIYLSRVSRPTNSQENTLEFVKDVGWWAEHVEFLKYYNQLIFSLNDAPVGHLPALWYWSAPWWKAIQHGGLGPMRGGTNADDQTIALFMSRLRACSLE